MDLSTLDGPIAPRAPDLAQQCESRQDRSLQDNASRRARRADSMVFSWLEKRVLAPLQPEFWRSPSDSWVALSASTVRNSSGFFASIEEFSGWYVLAPGRTDPEAVAQIEPAIDSLSPSPKKLRRPGADPMGAGVPGTYPSRDGRPGASFWTGNSTPVPTRNSIRAAVAVVAPAGVSSGRHDSPSWRVLSTSIEIVSGLLVQVG